MSRLLGSLRFKDETITADGHKLHFSDFPIIDCWTDATNSQKISKDEHKSQGHYQKQPLSVMCKAWKWSLANHSSGSDTHF
jgi:hypothetical protein